MTTQAIKDLIASAIAGQGNQVDSGGKLAEILNAIVEMAGQGGGTVIKLTAPFVNYQDYTKAQMAELIGVSEADIDVIMEGAADTILEVTEEINQKGTIVTRKSFIRIVCSDDIPSDNRRDVTYASWNDNDGENYRLVLTKSGDKYFLHATYEPEG